MKKIIILLVLLLSATSCTGMKHGVKDSKLLETRLVERVNEFQVYFLNNEPEKMWDMMPKAKMWDMRAYSELKKDSYDKEGYLALFRQNNHMVEYHDVRQTIEKIEIAGEKAKVENRYFIQPDKDKEYTMSIIMIYYWYYDNNDWYFEGGGKIEPDNKLGWN